MVGTKDAKSHDKAIKEEMEATFTKLVSDEETAVEGVGEPKAAKKTDVATAAEAIKTKTARTSEFALSIAMTASDIEDSEDGLIDGQKFLLSAIRQYYRVGAPDKERGS